MREHIAAYLLPRSIHPKHVTYTIMVMLEHTTPDDKQATSTSEPGVAGAVCFLRKFSRVYLSNTHMPAKKLSQVEQLIEGASGLSLVDTRR